jgi:phage FluMu protein Com
MPIKFACEHCGARLSVSSRKAGAQAKCPKCQQVLQIPATARGEDAAPPDTAGQPSGAPPAAGPREEGDPLAEFLVYDSEAELIYATDDEDSTSQAGFRASLDPHKIAIPRSILYMQGALLGLVALFSLLIGVLFGRGCSPAAQIADDGPQACLVTGVVALQDARGETTPDAGAVVVIVPRDLRPERQASMLGLRPQDPPPDPDHDGLQTLFGLGGDYARTDAEGRFQLRVPNRGNYFLLAISAHAGQDDREQPKSTLAQIGRFFQLTPNMFEGHALRWQEEKVQRDRQLNIVFAQAAP